MPIERLAAEDLIMLWPDEIWPQDIGAIAVLDASNLLDPDGRFRIEAVRETVAARLHLVPRFRQLLHTPSPELGGPLWVDAPVFNLDDHVQVLTLAPPADETQLLLAAEQLRRRRLDRSRPLWEMWLLTGMVGRRAGLFMRTHHCIADGIAGVATLGAFVDVMPDATVVPGPSWAAAPWPSADDLRADDSRRHSADRRRGLATLAHPVSSAHSVLAAWPALRELLADEALPATSLDHVVGAGRRLAVSRSTVATVKAIGHIYDAKVNDVLLTAIAGGLRAILHKRGEPIGRTLRVYVPVSLRHGQYAGARGNQIAQMVVPLPIGTADPLLRLRQIAAETARRKTRIRPSVGKMPHGGLAGRMFLKLLDRQRVNVETADLPGPEIPLYLAGARLLELFPVLPLIGKVSLGVGALSYAGQFNMMAVADQDSYPDLDVFVAGVEDELRALEIGAQTAAVA